MYCGFPNFRKTIFEASQIVNNERDEFMYGAILGDIIGSVYEFDMFNIKTKDFPLFSPNSTFTDDSVMALAVAKAIMATKDKIVEIIKSEQI